jgi:hypothetical protein
MRGKRILRAQPNSTETNRRREQREADQAKQEREAPSARVKGSREIVKPSGPSQSFSHNKKVGRPLERVPGRLRGELEVADVGSKPQAQT